MRIVLALALVAVACGPSGQPPASGSPRAPLGVDTSTHSVPLEDVHFDTFTGGSIPLSQITADQVARLRDAIPPLSSPKYDDAAGGAWLTPDDLVLAYVGERGSTFAYPHKILNLHEIVNDEIDGVPVLISYCPLCRSGIVYDRRLEGRTLSFGNTSALYQSDLVMFDRETGSYWWQVAGRAIVGPLTDKRLRTLPSTTTRWAEWRAAHPDTKVLSRDTGHRRNYAADPFTSLADSLNEGRFPFPVSGPGRDDRRLPPGEVVLGVAIGDDSFAFAVRGLANGAANVVVGGMPIVVLARDGSAAAYAATVDGRRLTFAFRDGAFVDEPTGSRWDAGGVATGGSLKGKRLDLVPSRTTFWFAYVAAFPDTRLGP